MKFMGGMLIAVLGAAALGGGTQLLPIYIAHAQFNEDLRHHARVIRVGPNSADQLGDLFYGDALRYKIPLQRENLRVDLDRSGTRITRVTADYDTPVNFYFFRPTVHWHTQFPRDPRADSATHRFLISAAGLILGLYWFFKGLGTLRRYRVVADTPVTPIRGIAMGLVQIRGQAAGESTLASPVTNTPCYFYQVQIEKWGGSSGSGMWTPYRTDAGWVPFRLADETGSVLVNPRELRCDLDEMAKVEVAKSEGVAMGHAWEVEEPATPIPGMTNSPSELRRYIHRVESGLRTALFQGTDSATPSQVGSQQKKFSSGFMRWLVTLAPLFFGGRPSALGAATGPAPGDFRLTEQCIIPQASYDMLGTCMPNRDARDGQDRHVIARGEHCPTFLISRYSEKELEGALRGRVWRYVLGGGAVAVGFAAALLDMLGYL